jgi:dipeptidase
MTYHNSFMLADPQSAWVLETAGTYWAAKQIVGIYAISNGLTLGDDFDRGHPDLNRFAKGGQPLHFAHRFSDRFYTFFSASRTRRSCSQAQLNAMGGQIDIRHAMAVLQDHGESSYRPDSHWLGDRICAHAANGLTRHATQTTGSLVAHLKPDRLTVWVTGTAAPCTAIFKPVRFSGEVLPDIGPSPGSRFDPSALWWLHEQFHRRLLFDFADGHDACRKERKALQDSLIQEAREGQGVEARDITSEAFRRAREWTEEQIRRSAAGNAPRGKPLRLAYRRYWAKLNRQAGMPL